MSFIKQTLMEHRGTQSILSLEPVGTWVPALWQRGPQASMSLSFHTFTCKGEAQKHNLWITDLGLNEWTCEVLRDVCADLPPGKCSVHASLHTPSHKTAWQTLTPALLLYPRAQRPGLEGELLKVTQEGSICLPGWSSEALRPCRFGCWAELAWSNF